jgi:hypothetical protein
MKHKKLKIILLTLVLVAGLGSIFYFGVLQSVLGVNEALDYKSTFDFNDGDNGLGIVEATLTLPIQTQEFTLTPYYNRYTDEGAGKFSIKYEVFNYNTNSWEVFHDKTWMLESAGIRNSRVKTAGGAIYQNNVASKLFINKVSATGVTPSVYNKYYACMTGITVEQATSLGYMDVPTTTQIYNNYCIYPDELAVDTDNSRVINYVPTLLTLNTNYINTDNKALFKITYYPQYNMDGAEQDEFKIELWRVTTAQPTVWTYNSATLTCDMSQKYTYELTALDYYSEVECLTAYNLPLIPPVNIPPVKKEIRWDIIILIIAIILVISLVLLIVKRRINK